MLMCRAVHELGRIGFGTDPQPTRLNWVNGNWTHGQPNVWVGLVGLGHQLSGSDPSGDFGSEADREIKT